MTTGPFSLLRVRAGRRRGSAFQTATPPVFLFSGIGADYPEMGAGLFRSAPVFRDELDRCDAAYFAVSGTRLIASSLAPFGALTERRALGYVHASLFSYQYALAQMWIAAGVMPRAVLGYSLGEDAAACVSGAAAVEDLMTLVVRRAEHLQRVRGGAMAVVFAGPATSAALLTDGVEIAALAGPGMTVVSGRADAVDELVQAATTARIHVRPVRAACAFHSSAIDPIVPLLESDARCVRFTRPRIPMLSGASAEWVSAPMLNDPGYWGRRVRGPVRLWDAIERLRGAGARVFAEIGPHPMLLPVLRRAADAADVVCIDLARSDADALGTTTNAANEFARAGIDVDFTGIVPRRAPRLVAVSGTTLREVSR